MLNDIMTQIEKIGPYNIKSRLGFGGFATVYIADDPRFEREVALKVLGEHLLDDPNFQERFMREVKTIAKLEHRAIVPVYDTGIYDGKPYLAMRYLRGGTLWDQLKKKGHLPLDEVCRIVNRLATALDYAHAQNVVHRDIKPANVLLDRDGMPYLSDFGIAHSTATAQKSLTDPDMLIGSFPYMAPEQLKGQEITPKTDIYQFGIMIFELLTGQQPFFADDPAAYVHLHTTEPVPSIHRINPDLPPACDDIIRLCLAKEPDDRYQTLSEMADQLTLLIGKKTTLTLKKTVQNLSKTIGQHKFEGYEIKRELGRGHMAIAYLVDDVKQKKELVLKALPPELLDDPIAIRHIRRQAEIIPKLQHEAIVPVYSYRVGEKSGWPHILMAYMQGGSLKARLRDKKPIPLAIVSQMFNRLASALSLAHERGIVHGDIQPSNVLLDEDGQVYLVDFGLSSVLSRITIMTVSETAVGSPAYKPPERWHHQEADIQTDIYQLGALLFEMLTGKRPFPAKKISEIKRKHINDPVPSAQEINPTLPPSCDILLQKAMAKAPSERFETPNELAAALAEAVLEKERLEQEAKLAAFFEKAQTAIASEDWEEAIANLKQIVEIDPDFNDAVDRLEEAHKKKREDFEVAQRHREDVFAAKHNREALEFTLQAASSYFNQKNWSKAIEKFQEVLQLRPGLQVAQEKLNEAKTQETLAQFYDAADGYIRVEQWQLAINALENIQTISSGYRDTDDRLKSVRRELNLEQRYNKAKRLYTERPDRLWQAKAQFEQLENQRAHYKDVSLILEGINQKIELDEQFEKVIELERKEAWHDAIAILRQIVNVDEGYRNAAQKLVQLNEKRQKADYYEKAKAAFDQKKWEASVDWLERCKDYRDANDLMLEAKRRMRLEELYQDSVSAIQKRDWQEALGYLEEIQTEEKVYKNVPSLLEQVKDELVNISFQEKNAMTRTELFKILVENYSESELQTLCFKLEDVDYERLPGPGKEDKVRELIIFFERRQRLEELCRVVRDERPVVTQNIILSNHSVSVEIDNGKSEPIIDSPDLMENEVQPTKINWFSGKSVFRWQTLLFLVVVFLAVFLVVRIISYSRDDYVTCLRSSTVSLIYMDGQGVQREVDVDGTLEFEAQPTLISIEVQSEVCEGLSDHVLFDWDARHGEIEKVNVSGWKVLYIPENNESDDLLVTAKVLPESNPDKTFDFEIVVNR